MKQLQRRTSTTKEERLLILYLKLQTVELVLLDQTRQQDEDIRTRQLKTDK